MEWKPLFDHSPNPDGVATSEKKDGRPTRPPGSKAGKFYRWANPAFEMAHHPHSILKDESWEELVPGGWQFFETKESKDERMEPTRIGAEVDKLSRNCVWRVINELEKRGEVTKRHELLEVVRRAIGSANLKNPIIIDSGLPNRPNFPLGEGIYGCNGAFGFDTMLWPLGAS